MESGPASRSEPLDLRARILEHGHERIVLCLCEREIDRLGVERALGLVRRAEALARPVDEHAQEAAGHALSAVGHGALSTRPRIASVACPT